MTSHAPARRGRAGLIFSGLLTAAGGALIVGLLVADNPLNLRHFGWMLAALVAVTTISAVVTALLLPANWIVRGVVGSICGLGGAAFAVVIGFVAFAFGSSGEAITRVDSPDGRYALVRVLGRGYSIDPQYDVLLTTGTGVFARETLVWRGVEEGAAPASMRFVGPDEIELTTTEGCTYRSRFNPLTLNVDPVWYASHTETCASPR